MHWPRVEAHQISINEFPSPLTVHGREARRIGRYDAFDVEDATEKKKIPHTGLDSPSCSVVISDP